jgi:hypothetical protein
MDEITTQNSMTDSSPKAVSVIYSARVRHAKHVVSMAKTIFVGKPSGKQPLRDCDEEIT